MGPEPGPDTIRDYEEEFYYTEIEQDNSYESFNESGSERSGEDHSENINVDVVSQEHILTESSLSPVTVQRESSTEKNISSSSAALGDHIGMVRPSYEAPTTIYVVNNLPSGGTEVFTSPLSQQPRKEEFLPSSLASTTPVLSSSQT